MAIIDGTSGPDILNGTPDGDYISDLAGDDQIFGLEGWDFIIGGEGNDFVDGGGSPGEIDFVSYQTSTSGVHVNLADGMAYDDGLGGSDTLVGIEGVDDSPHDDTIIGDANDNWVTLFHGGIDYVDAGDGFDLLLQDQTPGPVTINLHGGWSIDGQGNTDTTLNFEAAHGGAFGDHITLTNGDGYALGRAGDDTIFGLDGNDNLIGGSGNDILDGGDGGFDAVDYFDDGFEFNGPPPATHGANVNLATGIAIDGWGDTDLISNVEMVNGSQFDDIIIGNTGTPFGNMLGGNDGNDFIHNGGTEGFEFDHIDGGNGNDTLTLEGWGNAHGGNGDDIIQGVAGGNSGHFGDDGNDVIHNGGTNFGEFDFIDGGSGDDILTGKGSVAIIGGAGNDVIRAEYHNDPDIDFVGIRYDSDPSGIVANLTGSVNGGLAGGDPVGGFLIADGYGGIDNVAGFHVLMGSESGDQIFVDSTFQSSYGNWIEVRPVGGDDTIVFDQVSVARLSYSSSDAPVYADMEAGIARDLHDGDNVIGNDTFVGANQFRGSQGGDVIFGASGDDQRLRGQDGDDQIDGRAGNDLIEGENGADVLLGGLGNDQIFGGSGNDLLIDNGTEGAGAPTGPGKGLGHLKGKGNGHEKHEGGDVPGHNKHHGGDHLEDNDVYTGGGGHDTFVFLPNNGHDAIMDFSAGAGSPDVIDLSAWMLSDFDALLALADDQGGTADVVLTLDPDSTLTLNEVQVADLHADDFLFV